MSVHPWNRSAWDDLAGDRARLPHALLLHGPRGIGKRDFAAELARWLLCEAATPEGACGQCKSCGWFAQDAHPDFKRVEPASESATEDDAGKKGGKLITISDIRQLNDFFGLVSHQGGWRVVIIQPAELLNAAAANALLKTLEEPPANILIILVAHQPRRLPATVLSRCRKLALNMPDRALALEWLTARNPGTAAGVLDEVGGAPLLALECAEPERLARRGRFLAVLSRPDAPALSALAQDYKDKVDEAWSWLSRWVYDLLAVQAHGQARYFPEALPALRHLLERASPVALWQCQQEILAGGRWLRHPLNGQLLLESWLLRYLSAMGAGHGR